MKCCPWGHGLRSKKLLVIVAVQPTPIQFPSQRPVVPSVASVTSVANDKGDNEMILGSCAMLLFRVGLPVKNSKELLSTSILAIWPAHLNFIDLITLTLLGER